jgi:hypothetical protein
MKQCAGCGAEVDGDVCDDRCAEVATTARKWAGREPCEDCLEAGDEVDPADPETGYCARHTEQRNEAAHERMLADFYGGSSPQSIAEQYRAAHAQRS